MLNINVSTTAHHHLLNGTASGVMSTSCYKKDQWVSVVDCQNHYQLANTYAAICQANHIENKWLLMINPEQQVLKKLATKNKINSQNILKVHADKVKVDINNIAQALMKGNCAKVVLCNPQLTTTQLAKLQRCACLGKTECVIIHSAATIH